MDDLISVVVPVYNASKYIGSAIQSVLDQTYKNIEVIVVDDCSTDNTLSKLLEYGDKIKVIRHKNNMGAAAARNTGIGQCCGRLVAFLDGDDKWAPEKLEIFAESFSRNEDVLFAFSDFSRFEWSDGAYFALSNSQIFPFIYETIERQKYFDRKYFTIPRKDMFTLLLKGYPMFPSAMVVRKRIFDSIGMWRQVLRTNEDFDFGLRSCRVTDSIYIDEKLTMIGRHDANLTGDIPRIMEDSIYIYNLHLADTSYNKEAIDIINYYKGKRLCSLGNTYLYSGNNKKAVRKYLDAARNKNWFWHALLRIGYIAVAGFRNRRIPHDAAR